MSWQRKPDSADEAPDEATARRLAMNLLARREHSRLELTEKLRLRNIEPGMAESVIARLTSEGLQSDARFAESYSHSRMQRGQGPVRIRMELDQRGVSPALIEAAIANLDVNWRKQARDVRNRRFGSEAPDSYKEKARQSRFLQHRGFDHEQIRAAMVTDNEQEK